jgi:beta-N-acetylhexosaminidase
VIDMGWPSDDRQYADVATFGASRYVGQALAAWLKRSSLETEETQ